MVLARSYQIVLLKTFWGIFPLILTLKSVFLNDRTIGTQKQVVEVWITYLVL